MIAMSVAKSDVTIECAIVDLVGVGMIRFLNQPIVFAESWFEKKSQIFVENIENHAKQLKTVKNHVFCAKCTTTSKKYNVNYF